MAINLYEDGTETINLTVNEPVENVDVTYNPDSTQPQSGIAVAQALRSFARVENNALIFGGSK